MPLCHVQLGADRNAAQAQHKLCLHSAATSLQARTSYPVTLPPLLAGSGQPSVTLVAVVSHTKGASEGAQDGTVACKKSTPGLSRVF